MELIPAQIMQLKRILEDWSIHDKRELEATFRDASDATSFIAVAQRLKAKYTELPQEDYLNILTPKNYRFTVIGLPNVEKYCRSDSLNDIEYSVMKKDSVGPDSTLDIDEYGVRIKVRREDIRGKDDPDVRELLSGWATQRKAFRQIRRWSFLDEKNGVRIDMSTVRSTGRMKRKLPTGKMVDEYRWQVRFGEADIRKQPIQYEIEVELLPLTSDAKDDLPAARAQALKNLIRGIGEVLRGIQKNSILIRKSLARSILDEYKQLTKKDRFRGVAPITLTTDNIGKSVKAKMANIRTGYNVTDKADGSRMMGFVSQSGELFLIDMSLNVYRTGLVRQACAESLIDGEFVTRDKDDKSMQHFMVFDIYHLPGGKDVSAEDFQGTDEKGKGRHDHLIDWFSRWNAGEGPSLVPNLGITETNRILLSKKEFVFASPGDSIFDACKRMLSVRVPYHTDGLILTPNKGGLPAQAGVRYNEQLKWKPSSQNSVDFLVRFDKEDNGKAMLEPGEKTVYVEETREIVKEEVIYKIARLYVGASLEPAFQDPRGTVLFEQPLPEPSDDRRRRVQFKPVLFNPQDPPDTMANTCHMAVEMSVNGSDNVLCENGDPIEEDSIVEMRYEPRNDPGWRWIPMRIRYDKTERYQKRISGSTMNKDETAEGVWKSIYDPITRHMITTGSANPSLAEQAELDGYVGRGEAPGISKIYYERSSSQEDLKLVEGLRKFHRVYIKDKLLLTAGLKGGGRSLVDLTVGQAGDLNSWIDLKAEFVLGTDIAGYGIRDPRSGAYRRYLNSVLKYEGYENIAKMIFVIADSSKSIATGEAGSTVEESNMLRAIYGRVAPTGPIPPFVKKYGVGRLDKGADCVACMFAIHYFFQDESRLTSFLQNVSDSLKIGGLFVGCCFDGQKVFDTLADLSEGGSKVGKDGNKDVWKLTKKYSKSEFPTTVESLGLPIDVEFVSIGTKQTEFLMNFELLKAKMAEIGCELLTTEECRVLGIPASTQMFEETHELWGKKGEKFAMKSAVKQYSFLNRWFIFKRRRGGVLSADVVAEGEAIVPGKVEAEPPSAPGPKKPLTAADVRARMAAAKAGVKVGPPPLPGTGAVQASSETKEQEEERVRAQAQAVLAVEAVQDKKAYTVDKIFRFWHDAALIKAKKDDVLGIMDRYPDAGRWLAPFARFPIIDATTSVEYPTLEHYIAAMRYKLATNKPELARSIFSSKEGEIHLDHLRKEAVATGQGAKALTPEAEQDMTKSERKRVLDESLAFRKYDATFDEGKWLTQKDTVLEEGLRQRWEKDEKLRKIVMAAKNKSVYLLYYTGPGTGSELGGHRTARGTIDGENKVGRMLMKMAGYSP